jgi:hypothetical protein
VIASRSPDACGQNQTASRRPEIKAATLADGVEDETFSGPV